MDGAPDVVGYLAWIVTLASGTIGIFFRTRDEQTRRVTRAGWALWGLLLVGSLGSFVGLIRNSHERARRQFEQTLSKRWAAMEVAQAVSELRFRYLVLAGRSGGPSTLTALSRDPIALARLCSVPVLEDVGGRPLGIVLHDSAVRSYGALRDVIQLFGATLDRPVFDELNRLRLMLWFDTAMQLDQRVQDAQAGLYDFPVPLCLDRHEPKELAEFLSVLERVDNIDWHFKFGAEERVYRLENLVMSPSERRYDLSEDEPGTREWKLDTNSNGSAVWRSRRYASTVDFADGPLTPIHAGPSLQCRIDDSGWD